MSHPSIARPHFQPRVNRQTNKPPRRTRPPSVTSRLHFLFPRPTKPTHIRPPPLPPEQPSNLEQIRQAPAERRDAHPTSRNEKGRSTDGGTREPETLVGKTSARPIQSPKQRSQRPSTDEDDEEPDERHGEKTWQHRAKKERALPAEASLQPSRPSVSSSWRPLSLSLVLRKPGGL